VLVIARLLLPAWIVAMSAGAMPCAAAGTLPTGCRPADCLAELAVFQHWPAARPVRFGYGLTGRDAVAAHWFKKAVAAGDVRAMHNLGLMLWQGDGVDRDRTGALALLEQAAARGLSPSSLALGHFARSAGRLGEAARHYQAAAQRNDARGMHALGNLHVAGLGVPQTLEEAYFWYHLAGRRRYEPSLDAEARLQGELSVAQRTLIEARATAWEAARRAVAGR